MGSITADNNYSDRPIRLHAKVKLSKSRSRSGSCQRS